MEFTDCPNFLFFSRDSEHKFAYFQSINNLYIDATFLYSIEY